MSPAGVPIFLPPQGWDYKHVGGVPSFYVGAGDLNSGLLAFLGKTLLNEPSPSPN